MTPKPLVPLLDEGLVGHLVDGLTEGSQELGPEPVGPVLGGVKAVDHRDVRLYVWLHDRLADADVPLPGFARQPP